MKQTQQLIVYLCSNSERYLDRSRYFALVTIFMGLVLPACNPPSSKPLEPDAEVAGEMIAGEMIAGEMIAGEMSAGEMTAGEMIAGESAGAEPVPTLCEQYCGLFISACNAQSNARWGESMDDQESGCLSDCAEIEEGEEGALYGESISC